jgi:hypothetical protein
MCMPELAAHLERVAKRERRKLTWGRFERYALDGPDDWTFVLFWPQFLAAMLYLILAPMRDWWNHEVR